MSTAMSTMICPQCWGRAKHCPMCAGAGNVPDQLLSPHFALSEFLESGKAQRGLIPNVATAHQIANATRLCAELLEPLRAEFGPIKISSGIRATRALNEAIGGSQTSSHLYLEEGDAADTEDWHVPRSAVMQRLARRDLPFDQAIYEERHTSEGVKKWLHLSSRNRKGEQRQQLLMCLDGTHYLTWNPHDSRVAA